MGRVDRGLDFRPPKGLNRTMLLTSTEIARFAGLDGWHLIERLPNGEQINRCAGPAGFASIVQDRRWIADRERPVDYLCAKCTPLEPRWSAARRREYSHARATE